MASLLDIAPSTSSAEVVKVNGGKRVVVRRLNADALAGIAARFPDIGVLMLGGGFHFSPKFIQQLGHSVGPIIAAGCGVLGDEREEQAAGRFLIEDQLKLVMAIWKLTFPNGVGFFVETMTELGREAADEEAKTYKIRLRKSPLPSQPSSERASHQIM